MTEYEKEEAKAKGGIDFTRCLNRLCNESRGYQGPVCSHCDRAVPLDDRVPLDKPGEILCLSCNDRLLEELDDFTNNR